MYYSGNMPENMLRLNEYNTFQRNSGVQPTPNYYDCLNACEFLYPMVSALFVCWNV